MSSEQEAEMTWAIATEQGTEDELALQVDKLIKEITAELADSSAKAVTFESDERGNLVINKVGLCAMDVAGLDIPPILPLISASLLIDEIANDPPLTASQRLDAIKAVKPELSKVRSALEQIRDRQRVA